MIIFKAKKTGLVVLLGAVIVIVGIALAVSRHKPSEPAASPAAQTSAALPPATTQAETTTVSKEQQALETAAARNAHVKGGYSAECYTSSGGMLLGSVVNEDGDAVTEDPSKLEKIGVRNNNTGKVTLFNVADTKCTFSRAGETPIVTAPEPAAVTPKAETKTEITAPVETKTPVATETTTTPTTKLAPAKSTAKKPAAKKTTTKTTTTTKTQ